jgi:hypothetical protein
VIGRGWDHGWGQPGPVLFARYAYPPNALGYCGPADADELLERAGSADPDLPGLSALARQFDGAWPYLCLIAAANRLPDPLTRRVVEAYWIGNDLLERVPGRLLAAHVADRFTPLAGRGGGDIAALAAGGGRAHHNFHVFCVYPWVGMLRAGRVGEPMRVLQSCRIRWGTVLSVHSGIVEVSSPPLRWTGRALTLDAPEVEHVTLDATGRRAGTVNAGDTVSMHWDWVCDVLDAPRLAALRRYTLRQLEVANRTLRRPAADLVLG